MSKITRANIAAARAQRDILVRRKQEVPERIRKLAELDPDRLTSPETATSETRLPGPGVPAAAPSDRHSTQGWLLTGGHQHEENWTASLGGSVMLADGLSIKPLILSGIHSFIETAEPKEIFVVDEDNAARAEHLIHSESELGARPPHYPKAD